MNQSEFHLITRGDYITIGRPIGDIFKRFDSWPQAPDDRVILKVLGKNVITGLILCANPPGVGLEIEYFDSWPGGWKEDFSLLEEDDKVWADIYNFRFVEAYNESKSQPPQDKQHRGFEFL